MDESYRRSPSPGVGACQYPSRQTKGLQSSIRHFIFLRCAPSAEKKGCLSHVLYTSCLSPESSPMFGDQQAQSPRSTPGQPMATPRWPTTVLFPGADSVPRASVQDQDNTHCCLLYSPSRPSTKAQCAKGGGRAMSSSDGPGSDWLSESEVTDSFIDLKLNGFYELMNLYAPRRADPPRNSVRT